MFYGKNDHLSVTRFEVNEAGERLPAERVTRVLMRNETRKVDFNTLLPGNSVEMPFWVKVSVPGLYHVRFYFEPNAHQLKAFEAAGHLQKGDSVVVSANQYFVVQPAASFEGGAA
jgi:hypothetical protein